MVTLLKTNTNKNLKSSFRKQDIIFKEASLTADFLTELMESRRKLNGNSRVLKENNAKIMPRENDFPKQR